MWKRRRAWEAGTWGDRVGWARVLVEDSDGAEREACEHALRKAGYDVASCGGPEVMGHRYCPLVQTGECALVDGADVVYNNLRLGNPANRDVVRAHRNRARTPLVIEVPAPDITRYHPLLVTSTIVRAPARQNDVVGAVGEAVLSHRSRTQAPVGRGLASPKLPTAGLPLPPA